LRNVLAHEYGEIKAYRTWLIATREVVELARLIKPLFPPIED
jgi:uncharacterized protein with HEPN domain